MDERTSGSSDTLTLYMLMRLALQNARQAAYFFAARPKLLLNGVLREKRIQYTS